ncbi:DUF262 domain-containing protein [Spirilliplanes yamanashiensis]|uniref:DUF262 domain-containing protein n=1 Tax=Spirilliplanes yamanashiensis TaxID=42233 RepID=A0A8J3YDJ9_9ACTN|nr:DUF262 domain-containing protein [Spirilliplanes yamanashiensis]MDP9816582.1 uncharacterized protein with ParB-like and HNH nuclease domain [Spirilliplanes yamanashiensis]GIJ06109.1 hypothetical protein Sya03_54610 [Spirilliplanes yamanashiensis]
MSSITPHYRTIKQLLQSRTFDIDEYQREYKWERANVEELVSDLQTAFRNSYREGDAPRKVSEYGEYFLGSIIIAKRESKSYLVDGQQRVTSLTLLLIYLYRESKRLSLNVAATLEPLIFSDNLGEQTFNLDIKERVPVIRALFDGDEFNVDGKDESIQAIVAHYRDIEEMGLVADLGDALSTFIYWLLEKVGLIEIITASDAHAYSIFEAMNDRGRPLSPVDMLKAYLLAPVGEEHSRVEANRLWKSTLLDLTSWGHDPDPERDSAFVKAWLRAQYADSTRERRAGASDRDWEQIGTTFHRWLRDNEGRLGVGESQANLRLMKEDVPFFARAYKVILDAGRHYTPGLQSIFYNAHNDFTWQATVLLAPLSLADSEDVVRRKMEVTARYIDIWLMRRVVNYIRVGYSSVSYAMFLLCRDIRRKRLPELIDILAEKLDKDEVSFSGSEARGRHGIEWLNLNQFSRRYIFHLLARVTAYVEVESGRPDLFDKYVDRRQKNPLDLEHIWADRYDRHKGEFEDESDFYSWRENVGGLLLLPADVNRSYQDKTFAEKVPHYAKQNLLAASLAAVTYEHQPQFLAFRQRTGLPFHPYAAFGKEEHTKRGKLLLALAERIWSPSRLEELRS